MPKISDRKWILPQPPEAIEQEEYVSIPRVSRTIPFGYIVNPDDDKILDPVPRELRALEKAREYLKQYSYREVANWLSKQTDRSISHMGLKRRLENEQSYRRRAKTLRQWADRYKKAIETAEKLETQRIGAKKAKQEAEHPDQG